MTTSTQNAAPVEAVIISGPRRGEIVRLPEALPAVPTGDDLRALNAALDTLINAVDRVGAEVRTTITALRASNEAPA